LLFEIDYEGSNSCKGDASNYEFVVFDKFAEAIPKLFI
jgi:hypothetical protein